MSGRPRDRRNPPRVGRRERTRTRDGLAPPGRRADRHIFAGDLVERQQTSIKRAYASRGPRANARGANGERRRRATVSPSRARDLRGARGARAGPRPAIVIILQLGHLPVTYFSSPSLLQSEWAVGQVRSSHVKTPVASSLVEPTTSELRVTLKMAVAVVIAAAAAAAAAVAAATAATTAAACCCCCCFYRCCWCCC